MNETTARDMRSMFRRERERHERHASVEKGKTQKELHLSSKETAAEWHTMLPDLREKRKKNPLMGFRNKKCPSTEPRGMHMA